MIFDVGQCLQMSKFYCSLDKTDDDLRHIPESLNEYCNSFDTQTLKRWRLMRWAGRFRHMDTYRYSRAVCVTLFECSISTWVFWPLCRCQCTGDCQFFALAIIATGRFTRPMKTVNKSFMALLAVFILWNYLFTTVNFLIDCVAWSNWILIFPPRRFESPHCVSCTGILYF